MESAEKLKSLVSGKRVLFISTKNKDYIRNSQEISIIYENAEKTTILASKSMNYINRLIFIYLNTIFRRAKNYDVVFIGFAPQLVLLLFRWKFRRNLLIIDFFISIYDTFVDDRKKVKDGGILSKVLHQVDTYTIHSAEWIVVDTKQHGKYFAHEFGADDSKMIVLYLSADATVFLPRPKTLTGIEKKFKVLYFGSMLPLQGVHVVLDAARLLMDRRDIHFEVIGPLSKENQVKFRGLDNVTFIPWLNQESLATHIANADLCLAGHFNNMIGKAKRTIPGKAYIYENMEKPMILGENEANRERYEPSSMIRFVPMGDADALAYTILSCYEDIHRITQI